MKKLGDYKIIEKVGEGGMSTVYKGSQISLNRPVAIKILSKSLTKNEHIVKRFDLESLIIAKLTHPNIIHIIDRGITDKMHYFIMDYVEGETLEDAIKNKKYDFKKKVDISIQITKALSYAHKNGVIHRDIKPANILIDKEGHALVSDFGIAQLFDGIKGADSLTIEGAVMGTFTYMSPEQMADSGNVTAAADIYSLGVVMYEMFTGVKPTGVIKPPAKINPDFPKPLEELILKCIEREPDNRYSSADGLRDRLLELFGGIHIAQKQKEQAFRDIKNFEDKFAILDIIKENKFGAVYLFANKEKRELMVIKKIRNKQEGLEEAKLLSKLTHENLINIYGVSGDKNLFIIVMEYISGGSLKERLIKKYCWQETLQIGKNICEGLACAHANGIIHGNLRPSNILISDGVVKITDFALDEHYSSETDEDNWYHLENEAKSYPLDIYSTGVIFYEMLTGVIPTWRSGTLVTNETFLQIPNKIRKMILKMLDPNPKQRYDSIELIIERIDAIIENPETERKLSFWTLIFFTLTFVIWAGLLLFYFRHYFM